MSHKKELIDFILDEVKLDYPENRGYTFLIEQKIKRKSYRIFPDIQVFGPNGGLRAVIEIGYTRPEKLKVYKELGIKDVRWYDKKGSLFSEEKYIVKTEIRRQIEDPLAIWKIMHFDDPFVVSTCDSCWEEAEKACGTENDEKIASYLEDERPYLYSFLYTNGVRLFCTLHCDACGNTTLESLGNGLELYGTYRGEPVEIDTYDDFFGEWSRREKRYLGKPDYISGISDIKWDELCQMMLKEFNIKICYGELQKWKVENR